VKPQMKVQAARYALMKQRPYLATATIRLRLVASEACPHALAASEGWTLYYNPSLVEQTELETLVIQLRREVERLIRRHARRLKSLPREVAETASAMEIDDDLAGEYGGRPDWTLPQQMGLEAGRTAEEYALALLDMLSQTDSCQARVAQDQEGGQEGDSDSGSSGAGADSSSDEESDGRDGASADAPTPSATNNGDSSAHAPDSSNGAGTPAGDGNDQTCGARGRSRGDSSPQTSGASAGDSSRGGQSRGASGAGQNGACDAQRPSDQAGDDDARASDPASEPSSSRPLQQGSAASGRPAPWETDEEPISEVEVDQLVESTLRAAAEYAKTRGTQGANMARRYEAAAKNKPLPWQQILARYIARGRVYGAGRVDFSYSRPSRRQSVIPDVVLPSLRQPLLDVAVVVDTSGSISDDELGIALREVQAILKRGGVNEMRVVFGDTQIRIESRVRTVAEAVKAFRSAHGGGGTDMGHIVRAVVDGEGAKRLKNSRPPQLVVVITDGETPWGRAPRTRVPVIAVITPRGRRNNTPAWVKEVVIDE
jgi:predicted metal-dependent peptidase